MNHKNIFQEAERDSQFLYEDVEARKICQRYLILIELTYMTFKKEMDMLRVKEYEIPLSEAYLTWRKTHDIYRGCCR